MRIAIAAACSSSSELIQRCLGNSSRYQVIWVASTAQQAVGLCNADRPDLLLLDLFTGDMSGVNATQVIMQDNPCGILLLAPNVSAFAFNIFEAMGYGALDAIDMPELVSKHQRDTISPFLSKIAAIEGRVHACSRVVKPGKVQKVAKSLPHGAKQLVVIGASAGGPDAIRTVLAGLPQAFSAAVLVVQHLDPQFAKGMATWLRQHTVLPVRLAKEEDVLEPGSVFLASTDDHLILKNNHRLGYTSEPQDSAYRPSVDVLFESVSKHWKSKAIGVLLTGMGRDGARGLKALRDCGHHTIAQDRASSAVYGMPKAAAEYAAAIDILPLHGIAGKLTTMFSGEVNGE